MAGQTDEKRMITLAPDALVFINGKDTLKVCPDCDCGYKLKDVITSISVDLSVDSAPGTASLQLSNPQHVTAPLFNEKRQAIHTMQEVEIYVKSRFTKDGNHSYYPVFWGFVTGISENYSDGNHNLTINCKDILRWWEISKVNVNPSVTSSIWIPGQNPTVYAKTYSNQPIATVIRDLAKITMAELVPVNNISLFSTSQEQGVTDQIQDVFARNDQLLDYWKKRFSQVGRSLRIYGYNGQTIDNASTVDVKDEILKKIENPDKTTGSVANRKTPKQVPNNEGQGISFIGSNGPDITKIMPDNVALGGVNLFESDFESKLEIANSMKEIVKWEFFMDTTGELIFKPPFYNMDIRGNVIQEIEATDIIDWGFTEDESPVVTRADVTGQYSWYAEFNPNLTVFGMHMDYLRALQYGVRVQAFNVPYLRNSRQCQIYAQSEISRLNSLIKTGTISIIGRPEIRLGYPVYVRHRDAFYYVTGISHSFSFGGTFTTQLSLTAERKKYIDEQGNVKKNLAIILQESEDFDSDDVTSYMNQLVANVPNISYERLLAKIKFKFPGIEKTNLMLDVKQRAYNTYYVYGDQSQASSHFNRIYDPCINNPIVKQRIQTLSDTKHDGNQGKVPVFVEKFIGEVDFKKSDYEFQVTDEHGYYLVGIFPYGRFNKLLPTSSIASRSLADIQSTLNKSRLEGFAFMQPESTRSTQEVDNSNILTTLDDYQKFIFSTSDPQNKSSKAYRVRKLIETDVCNCGCHERIDET